MLKEVIMSDLNVALPSTGFVGLEKENVIQDPTQSEAVNPNQVNQELEDKKASESEAPLTASEVSETVKEVNSFLKDMNRNLSFSVDEQLGQSVIIVKDSESDEVIKQIPSEELVILRKKMDDVVGILFDTKV